MKGHEDPTGAGAGLRDIVAQAGRSIVGEFARRQPVLASATVRALGWATVDLERAARDIVDVLRREGLGDLRTTPLPRDPLLGASAWSIDGTSMDPALVLLEPDTEGILAASLARRGEGPAVAYVGAIDALDPAGVSLSAPTEGPLGAARLILGIPRGGHQLVLLAGDDPGGRTGPTIRG